MSEMQENYFDYTPTETLRLIYCGVRNKTYGHSHKYHIGTYLLCYVEEGQGTFYFDDVPAELHGGHFYVVYPHAKVHYETDPAKPWTIHWLIADGVELAAILQRLQFSPAAPYLAIQQPDRLRHLFASLFLHTKNPSLSSKMTCISLVYELFALLAEERSSSSGNSTIRRALDYIAAHYTEPIRITDLAAQLHLNNNYFTKLFYQKTGVTPMQHIRNLRFDKAAYLLKHTDLSIADVAINVGFSDTLYFSRSFHEYAGCSPTAYRKSGKS